MEGAEVTTEVTVMITLPSITGLQEEERACTVELVQGGRACRVAK
jgi:hypothetical protein